jgi:hypothetical protein
MWAIKRKCTSETGWGKTYLYPYSQLMLFINTITLLTLFELLAHYSHVFFVSAHCFVAVGTEMEHEKALSVTTGSHYSGSL